MSTTTYYATNANPPVLLRRAGFVDEAFADGRWQPTKAIVDFMFGHNDCVEQVSQAKAQAIAPNAF